MRKVKLTVAVPEVGTPSVLYVGTDSDAAVDALRKAKGTIDGEVLFIKNPLAHRRWKGKADKPAPKSQRTPRSKIISND